MEILHLLFENKDKNYELMEKKYQFLNKKNLKKLIGDLQEFNMLHNDLEFF